MRSGGLVPEKRDAIFYVRVTNTNKEFVRSVADYEGLSESELADHILTKFREDYKKSDSKPNKPRKRSK